MMPSDTTTTEQQRKLPFPRPSNATHAPPPHAEALPCPRCDSTNTKFCYYNNYNLSQPRHFCKSCRRYWTQGGTLRNVPVGGGSRKNSSKRHRSSASTTITTTMSSTSSDSVQDHILPPGDAKVSESSVGSVNGVTGLNSNSGVFMNLLNSQGGNINTNNGFLALGGFGSGAGYRFGLDEVGLGFGRGVWAFPEVGFVDNGGGYGGGGTGGESALGVGSGSGSNTWQLGSSESGVGGLTDGDGLSWPELAISMPGRGLK